MKLYRVYKRLVTEAEAIAVLEIYRNKNGHHCNMVADPATCCPFSHGEDTGECNCIDLQRLPSIELEGGDHAEITLWMSGTLYDRTAHKYFSTK